MIRFVGGLLQAADESCYCAALVCLSVCVCMCVKDPDTQWPHCLERRE